MSFLFFKLYEKFRQSAKPPTSLGRDRDWYVDLIPKFMMANGELVNILVHTNVTRYIEFKQIAGSYVFRDGRIAKVPSNEMEAVRSPLMGIFEKRRCKKFLEFIQGWKDNDPATHQGLSLDKNTMAEVYDKFGLEPGTRDFLGHAMALHLDDSYLQQPARETHGRILLYASSMARYGKSPYIYPAYGLGDLPQGFARLAAVYGGTYMLDKKVDEIVYENGKFAGVKCGDEVAKAKIVIGDPSYFKDKTKKVGSVIRAICILKHPIPNTDNSDSVQLVIPQNQVGRKNDIYIAEVSAAHSICPRDHYLAIVATIAETDNPHLELEPGLKLLGPIEEQFTYLSDIEEPVSDGKSDNVFISKSYDATSHFETVCDDIKDIYKRLSGTDLVLKQRSDDDEGANIRS